MAGKADFTEEEWGTLEKGVTGAGLLVAVSDKGFFDSFGEATTMAKHLAAGSGSDSPLVRDLAHTRAHGFSMRSSPQELEQQTVEGIRAATAIIGQKVRRATSSPTRRSCSTSRSRSPRRRKASRRPRRRRSGRSRTRSAS